MNEALNQLMSPNEPNPLTEVLRGIRLSRSFYCESRLSAPWGFESAAYGIGLFHYVVQGGHWLRVGDEDPVHVGEGDLVLLPHGTKHSLGDTPEGATVPVESIPRTMLGENASSMRLGGDGEETLLICGGVTFEPHWHPLLEVLPQTIIVIRDQETSRQTFYPLFDLLKNEAGTGRPGGETIITRLCDVLVMEALREWMEPPSVAPVGWLTALRDKQIGRAIAAIHRNPHTPWTVASLASRASMSRSVFTERFTALCGIPPVQYVMRWRMSLAGDWLQQTRLSTGEVADKLGYSSDATFSRAFKRYWGIAPGKFRRQPLPSLPLVGGASLGQVLPVA